MWLLETSFDIWRHETWKPVSTSTPIVQKLLPSTMSITQMPAVGATALGHASNCTSLFYRESNVLISDFLKLFPEINTRYLLPALVTGGMCLECRGSSSMDKTMPASCFCSQIAKANLQIDLERAFYNKLFLSSLAAGGQLLPALSAWRAQLWI